MAKWVLTVDNETFDFDNFNDAATRETRISNLDDFEDNRGKQIMDYLSSYKEDIDRIVILDDNDDGISNFFEEEFILVNRFYGSNEEIYQKALNILK